MEKNIIFNSLHSDEIDELILFDKYKIPTLESTLQKFPDTLFQIDVKTDEVVLPTMEVIKKTNSTDKVCIASFSSKRLKQVHKLYPEICLSMGPFEVIKLLLASFGLYRNKVPGKLFANSYISIQDKVSNKRFINYIHSIGLKIHVWTINDEDTMQKLIDLGVDGIITDRPKALKDLFIASLIL